MKQIKQIIVLVLLVVMLPSTVFLCNGCRTPSQQRRTFNTIWSLASVVDTSYKSYLDLVISGNLPTNSVPKVSRAYANFQLDLNVALLLVAGNSNAIPTAALANSAEHFSFEVTTAKQGF